VFDNLFNVSHCESGNPADPAADLTQNQKYPAPPTQTSPGVKLNTAPPHTRVFPLYDIAYKASFAWVLTVNAFVVVFVVNASMPIIAGISPSLNSAFGVSVVAVVSAVCLGFVFGAQG
jgi:hypothetical protein